VAWLFVQRLNQVTRGPLHEPYERQETEKTGDSPRILR
jgi:hypothetical protein